MKKKKIKPKEEEGILITKHSEFKFTYLENAQNVSQALELGGYFVKLSKDNGIYLVEIYSSR